MAGLFFLREQTSFLMAGTYECPVLLAKYKKKLKEKSLTNLTKLGKSITKVIRRILAEYPTESMNITYPNKQVSSFLTCGSGLGLSTQWT